MSHADLATQASTLGDRSYQKREMAAISIEMTIRQIMSTDADTPVIPISSQPQNYRSRDQSAAETIFRRTDQIQKVVDFLLTSFINR